MVPYRLNMARGHVLPLATRRRWLLWFAIYFLVVLVVLAVSVAVLTHNGIALSRQQEIIKVMERQLLDNRPGVVSVGALMQRLSREMGACEGQLGAINSFRVGESRTAGVILGLVNVMPSGIDLGKVGLDGAAARMECEVYVPAGLKADDGMTPPRLIALWGGEPLLKGRVNHFTSEKSERVIVDGQEVMSWRFAGVLGGGN